MFTPDSASFYAALAQTSASVVGLFGAVLGSQIIQHLDRMREERRDLLERINSVYKHLEHRINHWQAFRDYLERKIARERSILETGSGSIGLLTEMTWETDATIPLEELDHEDHSDPDGDLRVLSHLLPNYRNLSGEVNRWEIVAYAASLRESLTPLPHTKAAHFVAADASLLEKLASRVARFRARLFPRTFLAVLLVLAWLSITGIVWPLSALPGFSSTPAQRFMLLALGAGLLALMGFFAYQFQVLKRLGKIYWIRPH